MSKIKLLIFDYNGVIVDDLEIQKKAYLELAKRHGWLLTPEKVDETIGLSTIEKIKTYSNKELDNDKLKKLIEEKGEIYKTLVAKTKVLTPETKRTIEEPSKKYPLAILTGAVREQFNLVMDKEIQKKFKLIISGDQIKNPKPSPSYIFYTINKLGFDKNSSVYIGDTVLDMLTAKNAGIMGIGLKTHLNSEEELTKAGATIVINNLNELLNLGTLIGE